MENQRTFEFELPIGYVDPDGKLHKTATLRKMTGRDEALMSDKRNRNSGARLITELLGGCVTRLGTIDKPGTKVAQALYSADRHFLLLKLREITFGPEMQGTYSCPTCHAASTTEDDLSALQVVHLPHGDLPEDVVVELEDGYVERTGETYTTMVFRLSTGADEEKVAPIIRDNPSHGKNAMLARCLKAVGDMPKSRTEVLGSSIFSDLTMKDRALIDKAINNGGPGIKMRREISCTSCGRQFMASLDFSSFLALS
jgi:hypothetical protein